MNHLPFRDVGFGGHIFAIFDNSDMQHLLVFVCHGNICRSVAAEWIMRSVLKGRGLSDRFDVCSRATSLEEIGNDIYPPMKRALASHGIPFGRHSAKQITKEDVDRASFVFYMDENNRRNLVWHFGDLQRILSISEYCPDVGEIEDPWYTGRFDLVVDQLIRCCEAIADHLVDIRE